jgi:hypothetical protein
MTTDILTQAAALIQAGQKIKARKLLEPFIETHLDTIPAWLLLAETWQAAPEKKKILEGCLRFNPGASEILHALAGLEAADSPTPAAMDLKQPPAPGAGTRPSIPPHKQAAAAYSPGRLILIGAVLLATGLFVVVFYLTTLSCNDLPGAKACVRVLFIGNSYTYVNDLPGMFSALARAGGHAVKTGMAAEGGWAFSEHANSPQTLEQLKSTKWDFVVLQEQSQIPAIKQSRMTGMYPAARLLVRQIREVQAIPIFFQTWAHRNGWSENGLPGYEAMQSQIDSGYQQIAQELNVPIAPAGYAWFMAMRQNPQWNLWQEDGSHPNEQGTYLAACVFYAVVFRQSPEGLTYAAHLPQETAHALQSIAANVVLKNPKQWYLP